MTKIRHLLTTAALSALALAAGAGVASAQTALPGYHLRVFATAPTGMSAPDSIVVSGNHIWIGFGDGAAKDGSSGASTVLEYDLKGNVLKTVTIPGHNDGLRIDPRSGRLVALQNEDANPTIAFIDPATGAVTTPVALTSVNGGGGFDDMAFIGGRMFTSASNPTLNGKGINTAPAILDLIPSSRGGYIYETVLQGNARAVNTVTNTPVKLNLTDPDSLTVTPNGSLLMTDQADAQLILVSFNGKGPYVSQIPLIGGVQVDDTVFATSNSGTLYITDTAANTIYALTSKKFGLGKPYSASTGVPASGGNSPVPAFVGALYLDSGATVPIATGLNAPHGLAFRAH